MKRAVFKPHRSHSKKRNMYITNGPQQRPAGAAVLTAATNECDVLQIDEFSDYPFILIIFGSPFTNLLLVDFSCPQFFSTSLPLSLFPYLHFDPNGIELLNRVLNWLCYFHSCIALHCIHPFIQFFTSFILSFFCSSSSFRFSINSFCNVQKYTINFKLYNPFVSDCERKRVCVQKI